MIRNFNYVTIKNYNHILYLISRNYAKKTVRVRFAPSPTGYLHLGGLRTALYNYLFAKSHGGSMILRIEDTDQNRKVDSAVETLTDDLDWVGIRVNEGPKQGGSFGPYVQSERLQFYKQHVDILLKKGLAYRCFCTDRRINLLRKEAQRTGQIPKYDNRCRNLSLTQIDRKFADNVQHCIRFKLTSECKSYDDIILGTVTHDVTLSEGDPVIMKSDGFPTYHFANVVDDHLMNITHVFRGVEWQISTNKHISLYRAFCWEHPQYGHLPLIVNPDGTKLSKRQGDVNVTDYKNKGIFPLALINYVTLSGGGFKHTTGESIRLKSVQELSQEFQVEKINAHPSRLNPDLLMDLNKLDLKRQLEDKAQYASIIETVRNLVKSSFKAENLELTNDHIGSVIQWAVNSSRISTLPDLVSLDLAFVWIIPINNLTLDSEMQPILKSMMKDLENLSENDFKDLEIKEVLVNCAKQYNIKLNVLMQLLRSVLSGLKQGPKVVEMIQVLGKDVTLRRIQNALNDNAGHENASELM